MANPLLTLVFDLFVITSAGLLLYATLAEHRRARRGVVVSERRFRAVRGAQKPGHGVTAPARTRRKVAA